MTAHSLSSLVGGASKGDAGRRQGLSPARGEVDDHHVSSHHNLVTNSDENTFVRRGSRGNDFTKMLGGVERGGAYYGDDIGCVWGCK